MLAVPRFRPFGLGRRRFLTGLLLGGVAYNGYFICIAYAVFYAGAAIPPLIVGTLPVVLALIGNWRDRSVPWRRLGLPLGLIAAGVLAVNVGAFTAAPEKAPPNALLVPSSRCWRSSNGSGTAFPTAPPWPKRTRRP